MTALAIDALAAVRAAGGDVRLAGPYRLKLIAPMALPDDLIERVRAAKPDLLHLLQNKADATLGPRPDWGEAEEERAAIIEFEGRGRRAWAEALARLESPYRRAFGSLAAIYRRLRALPRSRLE